MSEPGEKERFLSQTRAIESQVKKLRSRLKKTSNPSARALKQLDRLEKACSRLRDFGSQNLEETGFGDITPRDDTVYQEIRHEIRNRLNHLSGPAQLLQRCLTDDRWHEPIARLRGSISDCLASIDGYGSPAGPQIRRLEPGSDHPAPRISFEPEIASLPARILVAEDEPENREILDELLRDQGHEVALACDGAEALEQIDSGEIDVVLLDLSMPKLDGFQVLESLRKSGTLQHTPVIVVTGQNAVDAAVRCIGQGATDFLTKPVDAQLLQARLESCLERKRLREREFAQFFPPALARQFARHPDLREMEGKAAEVSVLFCDIRGFSSISERLGPQETVRWLRSVMNALSDCVIEHGGVLVDYAGDELLAMWGAPEEVPDHARRACETALDMLELLPALDAEWAEAVGAPTKFGIGINSGTALVGNIGTDRKFKYGPLGNVVNLASRVQGATKHLHSSMLVTRDTLGYLPEGWRTEKIRRLCKVRVVNIHEPLDLFEVVATPPPAWDDLRVRYEQALQLTEDQQLAEALTVLGQILVDFPGDGPSELLAGRIIEARLEKRDALEAVWTLPTK